MKHSIEGIAPTAATLRRSQATGSQEERRYIWGAHSDFWALGGASILLWLLLLAADASRNLSPSTAARFGQISVVFSFLSVFVNYPHFMVSYRFGYGRGGKFVLQNWLPLLAVPLLLALSFAAAYFFYGYDVSASKALLTLDENFRWVGIDLGIRYRGALGKEIMILGIWAMYFTVGWHYAKQVFGALMICAKLRGYSLSLIARHCLKANLYGVAVYQFLYINRLLINVGSNQDPRFPGVLITGFAFPAWIDTTAALFLAASTTATLLIFARFFLARKEWPDANFVVAWASFLIWWIPIKQLPEFYVMAVPFFHSLQYLLFASKLEGTRAEDREVPRARMLAVVVLSILAGVAAFEIVPAALDGYFATSVEQSAWFFMSIAGIFFNVHHFFIDSAVWKFDQAEVRGAFFS